MLQIRKTKLEDDAKLGRQGWKTPNWAGKARGCQTGKMRLEDVYYLPCEGKIQKLEMSRAEFFVIT